VCQKSFGRNQAENSTMTIYNISGTMEDTLCRQEENWRLSVEKQKDFTLPLGLISAKGGGDYYWRKGAWHGVQAKQIKLLQEGRQWGSEK